LDYLVVANSEEGQVRKILKAEPLPDVSGHFFNLSMFFTFSVSTEAGPNGPLPE
jgi:Whirly transcription factor